MTRIMPCLWFDDRIDEAIKFYTETFKEAKVHEIQRQAPDAPAFTAVIELAGQKFILLNGGPRFPFTEAVSFVVDCDGQDEVDYFWNGYVGMTRDYFPRFHQLGPSGFAWAGCNGRAVGLSVALGRELAKAVTGTALDQLALPLSEPDPIPLQGLVRRLAPLALPYYRYLDWREI